MTTSLQLGPFTLSEQIGEGGMGAVYRGRHRRMGVDVAVKVLRQMTDPKLQQLFHREVQAHAGLNHPGVVYLFEYGRIDEQAAAACGNDLEAGSPFVAMELADGGTVRDALPVTNWRTACHLLVQILDTLAYAHARGVIHRDLKPENFLLFRADGPGTVKLADFGIAHAIDQEQDTATQHLEATAGTPWYIAPEQLEGDWRAYGPWTDLYAIGCVAWELISGHPPFEAPTPMAVAIKHATEPVPPLQPQFDIPEQVHDWIQTATAKQPQQRFQRAADALWALPRAVLTEGTTDDIELFAGSAQQGGGTTSTLPLGETTTINFDMPLFGQEDHAESTAPLQTLTEEPPQLIELPGDADADDQPPLRAVRPPVPQSWQTEQAEVLPAPLVGAGLGLFGLREAPFVNRLPECRAIWSDLTTVIDRDEPRMIFVEGEAGTGKSRLAERIATRAHEVGAARVIRAVHSATGGGDAEGLKGGFERILRTVKLKRDNLVEHLSEQLAASGGAEDGIRRDARALTEYLRPAGDDEVEGPRYQFATVEHRRALVARILWRLSIDRPLLLWIDDLQWGREALGVLEHIERTPLESPTMLVVATLRSDLIADAEALHERIHALGAGPRARTLQVDPLSTDHQRELLTGLLPLRDELADRLARRTEGHPLFAMQLLGHWIERGDITAGDDGFDLRDGESLQLPENIHNLWMSRLHRVAMSYDHAIWSDIQQAMELAAVLGRRVIQQQWELVLQRAGVRVIDGFVRQLIQRGLAERTDDGWMFCHGMLVETLRRHAREQNRWQLHNLRCARMLESIDQFRHPGDWERLADHWIEAGHPQRALQPLLDEIELACERSDDDRIETLLAKRATLLEQLDVPEDDPLWAHQNIERANHLGWRGQFEQAAQLLLETLDSLPDDQHEALRARLLHTLSRMEVSQGNRQTAVRYAQSGLDYAQRASAPKTAASVHLTLAWLCCRVARLQQAAEHARSAVELAEEAGDEYIRLDALRVEATVLKQRGEPKAGELFEHVRRQAGDAGYVDLEAETYNDLGDFARFAGQFQQAEQYYRDYLATVRELSRPELESIGRLNLAALQLRSATPGQALETLGEAEELLEAMNASDRWTGVRHLIRLAAQAAKKDRDGFAERWELLDDGWPDGWSLFKDHPWLLETAAEHAEAAGWTKATEELQRLAAELWERLGDDEAAQRLRA